MTKKLLLLTDDDSLIEMFQSLDGFEVHVSKENWYVEPTQTRFDVAIADMDRVRLTSNVKAALGWATVAFGVISPENLPSFKLYTDVFHDIWVKPLYPRLIPHRIAKGIEYEALHFSKSKFAIYFRREIGHYLSPMIGLSDLLRYGAIGELTEQQNEILYLIYSNGKKMQSFLSIYLDKATIGDPLILDLQSVSITDILKEIQDSRHMQHFKHKNIEIVFEISETIPPIFADFVRLLQILSNLLYNAVRLMPDGGKVTFAVERESADAICFSVTYIEVQMEDNSLDEYLQRLYIATSYAEAKDIRLSLEFAQSWLFEFGSELKMESDIGKGTTFHFTLSIAKDNPPT